MKTSDKWQATVDKRLRFSQSASRHSSLVTHHCPAFTLIELLVVIVILGILAGLAVPALKNISKSDSHAGAARQLLDDVGRARQLAISHHTTVYMVFVPTNFWTTLPPAQQTTPGVLNLCGKQLTGYTFIGIGTVGDQPGRHAWNYLAPWHSLPEGSFIAQQKFQPRTSSYTITDAASGAAYLIKGFDVAAGIPFPVETNSTSSLVPPFFLPYIAFNYLGQPVSGQDEYIPLAHGSVSPAINLDKSFKLGNASVSETPPGNSTGSGYNLVHIDALTGRARLEFQKLP